MKKYSTYNLVIVWTMIGSFVLGMLGMHLDIPEAGALFFMCFVILLMVWGPMPDSERYRN